MSRAASAGGAFLAQGTACAKPLKQDNARAWQSSKVAGRAQRSRESRRGGCGQGRRRGLGLSPLYDGGHGNFVLKSGFTLTRGTPATGLKTRCRVYVQRSRAQLDAFPVTLARMRAQVDVAPADLREPRNFFKGLARPVPLASA